MAAIDTVATALGWGAVALFTAGAALLLYVRRVSRSTLVVDAFARFAPALAIVGAILLLFAPMSGAPLLATHAILFLLSLTVVVPAIFMARVGRQTDGYVIVSRGLLEGIHLKLDDMYGPGPARIIMYGVGRKAGLNDMRSALQGHVLSASHVWKRLPYIFRLTGLGRVRVARVEPRREVELAVEDSFEVFHSHEGGAPGCDITRGYLAGIGKALHPDLECQAEETRCAQVDGGSRCEFTVRWFEPVRNAKEELVRA